MNHDGVNWFVLIRFWAKKSQNMSEQLSWAIRTTMVMERREVVMVPQDFPLKNWQKSDKPIQQRCVQNQKPKIREIPKMLAYCVFISYLYIFIWFDRFLSPILPHKKASFGAPTGDHTGRSPDLDLWRCSADCWGRGLSRHRHLFWWDLFCIKSEQKESTLHRCFSFFFWFWSNFGKNMNSWKKDETQRICFLSRRRRTGPTPNVLRSQLCSNRPWASAKPGVFHVSIQELQKQTAGTKRFFSWWSWCVFHK